jgi:hypothetical protein
MCNSASNSHQDLMSHVPAGGVPQMNESDVNRRIPGYFSWSVGCGGLTRRMHMWITT